MFVSEMFDQLRDLLNDGTDTQVPYATKKLYLNRGINRLFPRVFRIVEDATKTVPATGEIVMPTGLGEGHVVSMEVEQTAGAGDYLRFEDFDIIQGDEDQTSVLRFTGPRPPTGAHLRIRYASPPSLIVAASYAAAQSESWSGPDRVIGLPALYAMGMITARKMDDRQDYTRYSTTQATNGVSEGDLLQNSQMWFGQFDLELADHERPLPISRD